MSFTEVFGGSVLYPSGQSYLSLTFAVDQSLQWPIEQQIAGEVVSSIMDLTATSPGLNVDMPDARQVSNGLQSIFNNVGPNSVTVRNSDGGTIISLGSGEAWAVYLVDNSTPEGVWRIFQLGASVSVANASALAGAGLKSIGSTLNQRIAPTSTSVSPLDWVEADRGQLTIWTGGVGVLNLPSAEVVGSDWFSMIRNAGSGDLTLTPSSGMVDSVATLALAPGGSAIVVTDGVDFFTVGLGQSSSGVFDFIEINVAGSGDFVLSGVRLNRISYRFIGALTGDRSIIVPNTAQQYWVDNSTTGAFSLTVATTSQAVAVQVPQGARNITYCDGNAVVPAESSTINFPVALAQGGTGAISAAGALTNLGGVPISRTIATAANSGLAGGGNFAGNRNLTLDSNNLPTENAINADDDLFAYYDASSGGMRKTALQTILTALSPSIPVTSGMFDGRLTGVPREQFGDQLIQPTVAIRYTRVGDIVFLKATANLTGPSNSSSMTIENAPAVITPASGSSGVNTHVLNDASATAAFCSMSSSGTLTFSVGVVVDNRLEYSTIGFSTSGLKGIQSTWNIFYSVA